MKLKLFSEIYYFFYNIKEGLKNLWAYKSIIWKDRDWDNWYLLDLIYFKLERMEKCFKSYPKDYFRYKRNRAIGKEIEKTRKILKQYSDDNYLKKEFDRIDPLTERKLHKKLSMTNWELMERDFNRFFEALKKCNRWWD